MQKFVHGLVVDGTFMYSDDDRSYCQLHLGHCVPTHMRPLNEILPETDFLSAADLEAAMLQRVRALPHD